jgi:tetratricopeptide (TPR) repeat protein
MQKAATSNLFLTELSSAKMLNILPKGSEQGGFYQQLAQVLTKAIQNEQYLTELGRWLVAVADRAYVLRRMEIVEEASRILMSLPLSRNFENIARFYQAYGLKRRGQFDEARSLFEQIVEEVPPGYKARAILALGSTAFDSGDYQSALPFYNEASKVTTYSKTYDSLAAFSSLHMLAVIKSIDGDYRGALVDLEKMAPMVRTARLLYPPTYYTYLNSFAIEMAEVGRLEEAQNISRIVLASPYTSAYPEYRETWDEIQLKSYRTRRSVVSFYQKSVSFYQETQPENVLQLPERSQEAALPMPGRRQKAAKVISLQQWKEKMAKEDILQNIYEMSDKDLFLEILELSSQDSITTTELRNILVAVIQITSKQDNPA